MRLSVVSAPVTRPWNFVDFVLVVLGGLLGAFVAAAISIAIDDSDLSLLITLLGQYAGHLSVIWLLSRDREDDHARLDISINGKDFLYLPLGVLIQIVLAVLFAPLANLLLPDEQTAQEIGDVISSVDSTVILAAIIGVTVVVAPLAEEMMFRGVLLRSLGGLGRRGQMAATALIFAAFHLVGLDPEVFFESAAVVLPQLFVVGLILAWVTLRDGRLGPAIMLHSGFNLLAAIAILAAN